MATDVGYGALVFAALLTLGSITAAIYARKRRSALWLEVARRALLMAFPFLTLSLLTLVYLLARGRYEVQYVYAVVSQDMTVGQRLVALWGGQAGSLLFWTWLLSACVLLALRQRQKKKMRYLPWFILILALILIFFLLLLLFFENPFRRFFRMATGQITTAVFPPEGAVLLRPVNGQGLNPLLRHPAMALHPPLLYLGFVGFAIPYALAIAALVVGRVDEDWLVRTRRWVLFAWLFLSCGLVAGMRWAHEVLGWGGYWGWDPVETAALLPWLVATPLLHTLAVQERRGAFAGLNLALMLSIGLLTLFATFLTRSGMFASVHAFAQSDVGPAFLFFLSVLTLRSAFLWLQRAPVFGSRSALPEAPLTMKERLALIQALLFGGIFLIVLWGMFFPLLSEAFAGRTVVVGPPFYERAVAPFLGVLLLLMGLAPFLKQQRLSGKTLLRGLWKFLLPACLLALVLWLRGVRQATALVGFVLVGLAISGALYGGGREVRAYFRQTKEKTPREVFRRCGGHLVHLGMAFMAAGILGVELFQQEVHPTLDVGQELTVAGYTLRYEALQYSLENGRLAARAVLRAYRQDRFLGELYPRVDIYPDGQAAIIPSLRSNLATELYVALVSWEETPAQTASFQVYVTPLMNWLWLGSVVFVVGTLMTAGSGEGKEQGTYGVQGGFDTPGQETGGANPYRGLF